MPLGLCTAVCLQLALPWKSVEALCLDLKLYRLSLNAVPGGQIDFSPVHSAAHRILPSYKFIGFTTYHSESYCVLLLELSRSSKEPLGPLLLSRSFLHTKSSVNLAVEQGENMDLRV